MRLFNLYQVFLALLKAFWSLRAQGNRKQFLAMLSKYMEVVVQQPQFLTTTSNSPYKGEYLHSETSPKILLVLHQFSRTGAPYAALYLARALFSIYGERPVVISPKDGPLREEFEQEGFATIVDPLLFSYQNYSSEACNFVAGFDRVVVTPLSSFDFVRYFRGIAKRLTWWIHETDESFTWLANSGVDLPLLFAACETIWLGSPLCFPPALQYAPQIKLHLLLYGCPDTATPHCRKKSSKIIFSIVGTVCQRKGQDIFLDAVVRLPDELRSNAIFRIIGSPHSYDVTGITLYKKIRAESALIPEVEFYENMPLERLHEFYAETDVFVSASRDDPMPIVITQGLMYSKVCLCSSAIGQAQLLADGKDGLIFSSESAESLSKKMAWVLQNAAELAALGLAGRELYEKYFLMSSFVANVKNLIRDNK